VNGSDRAFSPGPGRTLLTALREDLGLTGARYGCAIGVCGVRTVLVDGEPVRARVVGLDEVAGGAIETVEGLFTGPTPALGAAFVEAGAMQCGYCIPTGWTG
jgi:aerobic-type carbon monoxide dehydrogenase small subunit (CoxS/CutS family)